MKKIFLSTAAAVLACGSAFAATTFPVDQVRIYLNPGHGSWGPNDRPMGIIGHPAYSTENTDTTSFFESNTNLHKAFALLDHLVEAGVPFDRNKNQTNENPTRIGAALDMSQNIVMSHVKVGPYPYVKGAPDSEAYNRSLSEISAEVEANNFDIFISIHSNAASEGSATNYPLFLYRGSDAKDEVPGSKELATHIWPYTFSNEHQTWSYYSMTQPNVRGDWDFYGSHSPNAAGFDGYLGALKHGAMGFLVEGYFHTYQPARHRAQNDDICRHEGHLYARGLIDYMGWKTETTGEIYGIVRDLHEKFSDPLYTPAARTNDVYKPLNGVTVKLLQNGKEVKTYKTDNEYNGAFVFTNLEPGTYTLTYSAEGYKPAFDEYLGEVKVEANKTTYLNTFLEAEGWVPPAIVYENYPDALAGNKAYGVGSQYNLNASAEVTIFSNELKDKTVRRQLVRDGRIYVLALDAQNEPFIYMGNIADNSAKQISTEGLELTANRSLKIADIAFTADNYLIASTYGKNQFGDAQVEDGDVRGSVAFYKWAKEEETGLPTGNPVEWFTSQNAGNYYRAYTGGTIAYSGTTEEGSLVTTAQTTGSSKSMRWIEFGISDNKLVSTTFINKDVSAESNWTGTKLGEDYKLIVSPRAKNQYIVDGSATTPKEWQTAAQNVDAPLLGTISEKALTPEANGINCFKYADRSLLVAPTMQDGKSTGLKLFDITDGLNKAREITLNVNPAIEAVAAKDVIATGNVVATTNDEGQVTDAYIELLLIRDGKVTKMTTNGVEQPMVRGHYAYNLKAEVGGNLTAFSFNATGDAKNGSINLTNADNTVNVSIPTGAIVEGENKVVLNNRDLPDGILSWEVELEGETVATPTKFFADNEFSNARGVIIDNNPESSYLGTVYVSNTVDGTKAKGLWKYDQNLTAAESAIGTEEFSQGNTASPFRLGMLNDGTVIASDWSDKHSGLWLVDPANLSVSQMFEGSRDAATGAFTNNGNIIGGGSTGVSVVGEGENTVLYTFLEDYPKGNGGNKLVRYNIGTNKTISAAPDAVFEEASGKLVNTNVEVRATANGVWASQTRSAGNNTADVPSLIYCDNEGNIVYNSGASNNLDLNGSNGSGFAINTTNDKLAICNGDSNVNIYDLTWNENVPTLTFLYTIPVGQGAVNEMAFDMANNLYIAAKSEFSIWSLPYVTSNGVTKAYGTIEIKNGGIAENVAVKLASVYPNPAVDVLNVNATEEIESIAIFALNGATVASQANVDGNQATIDVSGLAPGIYVVKVNNTAIRFIKK